MGGSNVALTDTEKTVLAEGASEGEEGMYHIASVINNRSKRSGKTTDDEVNKPMQFSGRWRKDLDSFVAKQPKETHDAMRRAMKRAAEKPASDATHYVTTKLHNSSKRPSWVGKMDVVGVVGNHVFMKERKK